MFSGFDTEPMTDQAVRVERISKQPNSAPKAKIVEMMSRIEARLAQFAPHAVIITQSMPELAIAPISRRYPTLYYQSSLLWPLQWGTERRGLKTRLRKLLRIFRMRRKLQYVRGVISTGEDVARQFSVAGPPNIPTGYDIPQFADPYPAAQKHKARRLVFLSPITEDNRAFDLVKIVQELSAEVPDVRLTMAGTNGDVIERLVELVADTPEITIEPKPSHDRMRALMRDADLCIASVGERSRYGVPDFLSAADLSGVPSVVSSNTPVLDDHKPGCLRYSVSDPAALRLAIRSLVLDDQAYQQLVAKVPTTSDVNFDRNKSFGSEIGRLLLEMAV